MTDKRTTCRKGGQKATGGSLHLAAEPGAVYSSTILTPGVSNMRNAAAALVENGQVIAAAEEERFVRIKHITALPVQAIRYCLQEAGVHLSDVDAVAVPWKYWQFGRRAALAIGAPCCDLPRQNSSQCQASHCCISFWRIDGPVSR